MSPIKPVLLGCSGPILTEDERVFFRKTNPFGFILFQRNCESPDQVRALTSALRASVGRFDAPIFIDQEGGRVARLKPPYWPAFPAMRRLGVLYERDAALGRMAVHLHALLIARMLRDVGINGNCAPVLDILIEGASSAIGDRAISRDPEIVAACARVAVDTYLQEGVLPVVKHLPGHGRVSVDPHHELPLVDCDLAVLRREDFAPFQNLKDAPIGMNCHLVLRSVDPENPVSLSKKVHEEIVRGEIGFEGLLFSDDLAMGALSGPRGAVALKALEAGADVVLYCAGDMPGMEAVCESLPALTGGAAERWSRAQERLGTGGELLHAKRLQERMDMLLGLEF